MGFSICRARGAIRPAAPPCNHSRAGKVKLSESGQKIKSLYFNYIVFRINQIFIVAPLFRSAKRTPRDGENGLAGLGVGDIERRDPTAFVIRAFPAVWGG